MKRVEYSYAGRALAASFGDVTRALLPVRKRSGRDELVLWSRTSGEPGNCEEIPCVALETVKAGDWDSWSPRWVKLFVDRFLIVDREARGNWHEVPEGSCLQGVLVQDRDSNATRRVYVVTIAAPQEVEHLTGDGRWPHFSEPGHTQPPPTV